MRITLSEGRQSRCRPRYIVQSLLVVAASIIVICAPASAQSEEQQAHVAQPDKQAPADHSPSQEDQTKALAKAVQNPVASLISVPLQNNTNFDIGPNDRAQNILNIQPVIPVRVSHNWNLIMRIITPVIYQPSIGSLVVPSNTPLNHLGTLGLGDMNPTFFLSPAKPKKLIWGVGPTFLLPTATDNVLGQAKWSIGPSVVLLTQPEHWTIGALINNVWSFAGSGRTLSFPSQLLPCGECTQPIGISASKNVNQLLLQYFINYNLKKGWYLAWQPIITANWEARSGDVWTVPFGGGIGRIMKIGFQPVNLQAQFFGNATHPRFGSPWSMRLQLAFLFPKLTKGEETKILEKKLKELEEEQQPPKK
jgi:hypothetical protein